MENAAGALKFAFAILLFGMALTLSISSFSQATRSVKAIIELRDRETQYMYVEPSENLSRTVGIETVVSTMYRAYQENIEIYFFDSTGKKITLYKDEDNNEISCIDLENERFGSQATVKEHLDIILGGTETLNTKGDEIKNKYRNRIVYNEGIYQKFKNSKFEEKLGEYDQGTGATKITKRVITYILQQ